MIEVRGLTKRYGSKVAVDDLSFTVTSGAVTGFLGPNGSGKSTTMRLIMGLDIPHAGSALLNGKRIRDLHHPMREVGVMLDAGFVHPTRSARNHLWAAAASNGIAKTRVEEVLAMVGLETVAKSRVGGFSLGMKQRLGLAMTLLGDPGIVILDEPANGLDPEGVHWIRSFLSHLATQGRTIFVSSHQLGEMSLMADRLVVIGAGKLISDTTVEQLTRQASGRSVLVRSPKISEFADALRGAGAVVTTSEDSSSTINVANWEIEQIGAFAFVHHIELHELSIQAPSLEDAFLELTANSQEFRAPGPASLSTESPPAPLPSEGEAQP